MIRGYLRLIVAASDRCPSAGRRAEAATDATSPTRKVVRQASVIALAQIFCVLPSFKHARVAVAEAVEM